MPSLDVQTLDTLRQAIKRKLSGEALAATSVGLWGRSSKEWLAIDLELQASGINVIPLPLFFSEGQNRSIINDQSLEYLFLDENLPKLPCPPLPGRQILRLNQFALYKFPQSRERHTQPTVQSGHKVSFTSGSSGDPKPISISIDEQWTTAKALTTLLSNSVFSRHLVVLPLELLLQNIAGAYAPLALGYEPIFPTASELSRLGFVHFDPSEFCNLVHSYKATSCILMPYMVGKLNDLLTTRCDCRRKLSSLEYVAVGGAPISPRSIRRARELGVPIYEGYGLTEASSVVSVNTPEHDRPGSVGKPLPHLKICCAEDGEILVHRKNGDFQTISPIRTGDIGHLDEAGYLWVSGRKKNLIITPLGRNISPEWLEAVIRMVFPTLFAIVVDDPHGNLICLAVTTEDDTSPTNSDALERINALLPEYAWIKKISLLRRQELPATAFTANGRPRRSEFRKLLHDTLSLETQ